MSIYRTCPQCGANLDPGEQCDCGRKDTEAKRGSSQKKSAVRRESTQADNPNNKTIKYSMRQTKGKVNRESRAMA